MKTIKLSRDEEKALQEVTCMARKHLDMGEGQIHLYSILDKIKTASDEPNEDLECCEQCNAPAWDGSMCHACGMKLI